MKSSIRLSPLISDGMVIQGIRDVKIWGSAKEMIVYLFLLKIKHILLKLMNMVIGKLC